MSVLRLDALSRRAIGRRILDRISLEVQEGECLVLLGEAGSGRAALLRVIAGLEEADEGSILIDGRDVTRLPPGRRPVTHVFQYDTLFGHPTVFDSVIAALPQPEGAATLSGAATRAQRLLGMVGLAEDAGSMPAMLPTGKRRRLALARALAGEPRLLLVGEGFGVSDPARQTPRRWLREVQQRLGLSMVLVAQGAEEALALADRIAVLEAGRIVQIGTPGELRRRPANAMVARLFGTRAAAAERIQPGLATGGLWLPAEALEVVAPGLGAPARVLGATMLGATVRLDLELLSDGRQIEAEVSSMGIGGALPPGSIVGLRVRPDAGRGAAALN